MANSNGEKRPGDEIRFQIRADLQWSRWTSRDDRWWVVTDPLSMEYFFLSAAEMEAARLLDGTRSTVGVLESLGEIQPGGGWNERKLTGLINRLGLAGLLRVSNLAMARSNANRQEKSGKKTFLRSLLQPLAIRLPLFDPTDLIVVLKPLGWILFHPLTVVVAIVLGLVVFVTVASEFLGKPLAVQLSQYLQGNNLLILPFAFVVVKSLHELGHLLACGRWKAECREAGVMFLVFLPCLYCDTSDSWRLGTRRSRAAIAAAGIYVELILATIAGTAFLVMLPGLARAIAMNVLVVCTINTLLLNGNPLLRYDGYYILSDLWGVPNLADAARQSLFQMIRGLLTGQYGDPVIGANSVTLTIYAVASLLYRTFVVVVILFVVWRLLEPAGLGLLALAIGSVTVLGLLITFGMALWSIFGSILMSGPIRLTRWLVFGSLVGSVVYFLAGFEFQERIYSRGVATFSGMRPVFVPESGRISNVLSRKERVENGGSVLAVDSPAREFELLEAICESETLKVRIESLTVMARNDDSVQESLAGLNERLQKYENQIRLIRQEISGFNIIADDDMMLVPQESRTRPAIARIGSGPTRQKELLAGQFAVKGSLAGWLTDGRQVEVRAYVSHASCERLQEGMKVICRWDCLSGEAVSGVVSRISPEPVDETPPPLAGDPAFLSIRNEEGMVVPVEPHYEVCLEMDESVVPRLHNGLVTVHFIGEKTTLWQWIARAIRQQVRKEFRSSGGSTP